jgi:hypothetical protein
MKRWKLWGAVVLAGGLICLALALHDWSKKSVSAANRFLTSLELAPLPEGVTEAHCKWSGLFAKYAHVKFAASQEQALAYLKAGDVPHYFEFSDVPGGYQVTAAHVLTTAPDYDVHDVPVQLRTGMLAPAWFKSVFEIRHGWFYAVDDFPVCYQMYYDLDAGQFYIYWTYS